MSAKLISIIGPPAAGKTTLARLLAEELPARLIREDYAGNPFLAESYVGDERARLPAQLYFLTSRVGQLSAAAWPEGGVRVSDYGYCQDALFARLRLSEEEHELYRGVAERLDRLVHPPDVLVLLDVPADELRGRIGRRGRDYEKVMTAEFLANMRTGCQRAADQAAGPVVRIDGTAVDFRREPARSRVVQQIRGVL